MDITPPAPSPTYDSFSPPPPPPAPAPSPSESSFPPLLSLTSPPPTDALLPPPPALSTNPMVPPASPSQAVSTGIIVGSAFAGVVTVSVIVAIIFCSVRVYKKNDEKKKRPGPEENVLPPRPNHSLQSGPSSSLRPEENVLPPRPNHNLQSGPSSSLRPEENVLSPRPNHNLQSGPSSSLRPEENVLPPQSDHNLQSGGSSSSLRPDTSVPNEPKLLNSASFKPLKRYSYDEIIKATDNFSNRNFLGEGGFAKVYLGEFSNGEIVAVKRLKTQGENVDKEFVKEAEVISRVHHKHLVSLKGYCITPPERMLVYEYVPNNSLGSHLHDAKRATLTWSRRLRIAIGSAKGLAYLHEDCHPKIIHRDIKATNILLDSDFEAKVADFGLAKLITEPDSFIEASTLVKGTFGYMAPEYIMEKKLTNKSDVYSYGVLLLELLTGRRAWTEQDGSLVEWAKPLLKLAVKERDYSRLIDPLLQRPYDRNEMGLMITCAAACILPPSWRKRPQMSQIVRALQGDYLALDQNAVFEDFLTRSPKGSSHGTTQHVEDVEWLQKLAFQSFELDNSNSSERYYTPPDSRINASTSGTESLSFRYN